VLTVLFVTVSQVIGREDCLLNDVDCAGWDVKLHSMNIKLMMKTIMMML